MSLQLTPERMATFSDGVIAVFITVWCLILEFQHVIRLCREQCEMSFNDEEYCPFGAEYFVEI
jgi:hypothetical protein